MVMLALAIGLDSITGAVIILLGGAIGFSTGTLKPGIPRSLRRKSQSFRCTPVLDTAGYASQFTM